MDQLAPALVQGAEAVESIDGNAALLELSPHKKEVGTNKVYV
jgi:hypothetical protein